MTKKLERILDNVRYAQPHDTEALRDAVIDLLERLIKDNDVPEGK